MRDLVAGIANLTRSHTAGFEALVFTVGPALAGWRGSGWGFASLWLMAVLVNGWIFALNDVIDLPFDRQNPARKRSPLVDGRISERLALTLAVSLPLAAVAIGALAKWPASGEVPLIGLLVVATTVNIYQKVTRHPVIMDSLFALTMAAPIPITAQAVTRHVPVVGWLAAVSLFFLALQLNSVGGNLKDLRADRETGFNTIAVSFGATIAPDGSLVPGRRYSRYCWSIQAITTLSVLLTAGFAVRGRGLPEVFAIAAGAAAACVLGARDLRRLLRGVGRPSGRGTQMYFAGGFATFLIAVGVHSHLPVFLMALGLLIIWTAGFNLYWWWYWRPDRGLPAASLEA
jgi:4-hydroxybenzoate polyprenyltransferase